MLCVVIHPSSEMNSKDSKLTIKKYNTALSKLTIQNNNTALKKCSVSSE